MGRQFVGFLAGCWRTAIGWLCHVGASVGLLLAIGGCSSKVDLPPPLEVLGSAEHAFDKCYSGDLLSHTFRLRNHSDSKVVMESLVKSCTCILAGNSAAASIVIEPKSVYDFPMSLQVSSQQETVRGAVKATYYCVPKNAATPVKRYSLFLKLSADVTPDYRVSPAILDFGDVDGLEETEVSRELAISPEALPHVEVQKATGSAQWVEAALLKSSAESQVKTVSVKLLLGNRSASGPIDESVMIETASERRPRVRVPIRGNYLAAARPVPEAILIESNETGRVRKEFHIETSHPSTLVSVASPAESIRVTFDMDELSRSHTVQLVAEEARKGGDDRSLECCVALQTESGQPLERKVSVPVYRF